MMMKTPDIISCKIHVEQISLGNQIHLLWPPHCVAGHVDLLLSGNLLLQQPPPFLSPDGTALSPWPWMLPAFQARLHFAS